MRKAAFFWLFLTMFVVMLAGHRAGAQVVLKPNGRNAAPLRLKKIDAKVVIDTAQFAATDLDLTFQNELNERVEADFLYTVPNGAVVTDFAYYYGDERVVARVAEKERAAAIYQHITTRMRDPALVEMVGKNVFRARIFPVLPNADLRVQIRYLQVLPVGKGKIVTYTLPLKTDRNTRLDTVSVDVRLPHLAQNETVTDSIGLPMQKDQGTPHLSFTGSNYRTDRDLQLFVHLPVTSTGTSAHLLAAPSGGPDGFFVLALSSSQPVTADSIRFAGIATYAVESRLLGTNRGVLVCGRYRGGKAARLIVPGAGTAGIPLTFARIPEPNNPAAKLWAAARIAHLSGDIKNRDAVVALSQRFTLPSRWTSWIAIPVAERERYEQEMAEADLERIANRLSVLITRGQGKTRAADALRQQFTILCRKIGQDSKFNLENRLAYELHRQTSIVVRDVAAAIVRGREKDLEVRRARERLEYLCQQAGIDSTELLRDALRDVIDQRAKKLADLIARGEGETPQGKRAWGSLNTVRKAVGEGVDSAVKEAALYRMQALAAEWVQGRRGTQPQWSGFIRDEPEARFVPGKRLTQVRLQELHHEIERLAPIAQRKVTDILADADEPWRLADINITRQRIIDLRYVQSNDEKRIRRLEDHFIALQRDRDEKTMARIRLDRIAARIECQVLDAQIAAHPTGADVAVLRAQREEACKKEEELRARMGDPLISVVAPPDARAVVARMPGGETLPLQWDGANGRWQARFDIPTYAAEGAYVVNVIIVLRDGARQTQTFTYHVDVTPPRGIARITPLPGNGTGASLYLVEVDADPDTARVVALLSGGGTCPLSPSRERVGRFFARIPLPERGTPGQIVTFFLTDRAHNRMTLTASVPPTATEEGTR